MALFARSEVGGPVVVGHRGAPTVAPENTVAAVEAAASAGAQWVEIDVRVSKDGVAVVHHDPWLADGRALCETSADELQAAGVETLAAVLDGGPAGLGVDVEVKNNPGEPDYDDEGEQLAEVVAEVLRPRSGDRPLLASSFNPLLLLALRPLVGDLPLGLVTTEGLRADAALELCGEFDVQLWAPHDDTPGLDRTAVSAAHARGLPVMVWPVDHVDRARRLAEAGVDALCTNVPAALVAAFRP